MLRKEKVNFILKELNKLYPKTPTPLTHQNKFELLIAVLLSAQCTDAVSYTHLRAHETG